MSPVVLFFEHKLNLKEGAGAVREKQALAFIFSLSASLGKSSSAKAIKRGFHLK